MMRIILTVLLVIFLVACKTKPHIEAKLKSEKIGENCNNVKFEFKLTSNFGGERFEFEKCLPVDFNDKDFATERKGDTVLVKLREEGNNKATFKLTLDVDVYPDYNFITIGDETYTIGKIK